MCSRAPEVVEEDLRAEEADWGVLYVAAGEFDGNSRAGFMSSFPGDQSFSCDGVGVGQVGDAKGARLVGDEVCFVGADAD